MTAIPASQQLDRHCWCGNTALQPFSEHYRLCPRCGTLVCTYDQGGDVSRVRNDRSDLYGREYWFSHMEEDLGFVNIYERARADLAERCLFWLRALLKYRTPPGRLIELGSAHGAFVALARWAGFDASGLELSPGIVAISKELFGVPVLQGPIEDQQIQPGTVSVIALMDVLEHFPAPRQTMEACLRLLEPNGLLLIQTPKFPEGKSFQDLQREGDSFLEHLKEREHLYL